MAAPINYFRQLGFEQPTLQGSMNMFNQIQDRQMQNQRMQMAVSDDVARRGAEQQQQQRQAMTFRDAQEQAEALRGQQEIYSALSAGDILGAKNTILRYKDKIIENGGPEALERALQMIETPDGVETLKQKTLNMIQMSAGPEQMARFTAEQARPEKTAEATAQIKNTAEYRRYTDAIRRAVASGDKELAKELIAERDFFVNQVDPYARAYATGQGEGAARIGTEAALTPELVERTRQQEAAKLKEQSDIKAAESARKNQTAFNAYETAARAVGELSGNATSGVFGLAPAVMADDRLFEGAIAIMRPAIKDVVRGAGEGTFTDADQALMNQMLPSRVDSPDVRAAKLQMLDNFIRAKLGQTPSQQAQPQSVPMSNAAPMQRDEQPSAQGRRVGRFIIEVE